MGVLLCQRQGSPIHQDGHHRFADCKQCPKQSPLRLFQANVGVVLVFTAGGICRAHALLAAHNGYHHIRLPGRTGLAPADEGFIVRTEDGDYSAGAVILATGARHRRLGLPREEELSGSGVCYCAVCDGAFYPGRPVAVVGGGDTAVRDALLLSNSCSEVYIIHRRHEFRAEASNVEALRARENVHFVLGARAAELLGEDELRGLVVEDVESGERRTLEVDGLFVAVGHESDNAPFAELAGVDEHGWFTAGEDGVSRTPGVFVAGDCRNKRVKQLVTAAGDGAAAATSACGYLDGKAKNG